MGLGLGIKFNFLSFSSRVGVGFLFYGVFSGLDGVIGVGLSSTATKTASLRAMVCKKRGVKCVRLLLDVLCDILHRGKGCQDRCDQHECGCGEHHHS